eukprot:4730874-Amphidinium_carterae.1
MQSKLDGVAHQAQQRDQELRVAIEALQSGQKVQEGQQRALQTRVEETASVTEKLAVEVRQHGDTLEALGPKLQAQFEQFGRDLLSQVSSMAKKRDAPPNPDRDPKASRGEDAAMEVAASGV